MSTESVKTPPKTVYKIIQQHIRSQISQPREFAKSALLTTQAAISANAEGVPSAFAYSDAAVNALFGGSATTKLAAATA